MLFMSRGLPALKRGSGYEAKNIIFEAKLCIAAVGALYIDEEGRRQAWLMCAMS